MSAKNQHTSLEAFLKLYTYKKESEQEITHTRIGDKKKIYGGAYSIPDDKMNEFYKLYYDKVFQKKNQFEYLTEKQNQTDGPILVDFDFRYNLSVKKRQHNSGHIIDIIDLYLNKLKEIFSFDTKTFPIYVFEKPNVNVIESENLTKDGIHMIIGINMSHEAQLHLRNLVLKEIGDVWDELSVINSWESVLDEGISAGYTNWQVLGSRKPHNESYRLTDVYNITMDLNDYEFIFDKIDLKSFDIEKNMNNLSAKYKKHPQFEYKEDIVSLLNKNENNNKTKKRKKNRNIKLNLVPSEETTDFSNLNEEKLNHNIDILLDCVGALDYHIKEAHELIMILPKDYYGPGSYNKWIRVGWALKNTDLRLFSSWIKFTARENCRNTLKDKNGNFDWSCVPELYEMWKGFENKDGLTYKSVLYWAKNDSKKEDYQRIRNDTVDYFIEESLNGSTEFDLANVLLQIYKDKYVCVSIKNNIWYEFINHKWREIDSGNTLRLGISKDMHKIYQQKIMDNINTICAMNEDDPKKERLEKKGHILASIATMLKKTTHKNNIMREARELFYDKDFMQKQDENNYLLCFKNGVFDFNENCFRNGKPEDYITKSTNIDYIPINKVNKKHLDEVEEFVKQLFPIEQLRDYMWDHFGSTLIGTNENQTFNIYNGCGGNGKTKIVELMGTSLGDYKGTVPITLVTQKRTSIGGTSSEIVQLKGKRYAVMQEPTKGDVINEGIMKEITGGDPIQGRALFKETVTFIPQFKLVVCTNTLFDIKDTGDGTWRRIRVCDFMSKFHKNPYNDEDNFPKNEYPYQYPVDLKIVDKFKQWKIPFMSKLVEIARKNKGIVNDCSIVLLKSNAYRADQDYLSEFIKEKIEKIEGGRIKKTELNETFKQWYSLQYGKGIPKGKEIYNFMDKKYGAYKNGWHNVAIIYETEDDDVEDI